MKVSEDPIRFASFLGDNAFNFYCDVVRYVGETSGLRTEMLKDTSAGLDAMIDDGQVEAVFGCGLPYVSKTAKQPPSIQLLAAPVLPAERYHDCPIYFSDVIVRADSPFQTFNDLRGCKFAYNQTTSFSGYVLVQHHLLTLGLRDDFFAEWVESGSHAASMDGVENGVADAAAIDSVVLEMELAQRPKRRQVFRVVESLGPAGMPPVIISTRLPEGTRGRVSRALLDMHADERGREILRRGGVRRFAPVGDKDYDDIRNILRALQGVGAS